MLSPEISEQLGSELCSAVAAAPRATELERELECVFERGRARQASLDELRLAAAIVLALSHGRERSE